MSAHAAERALSSLAALLPLLLLAPGALATEAELSLVTGAPVTLAGLVTAEAGGATLHAEDEKARGVATFTGATGVLSVWTYRAATLGGSRPDKVPVEEAREERFLLDGATFTLILADDRFSLTADARDDGAVRARGHAFRVPGHPVLLDQAHARQEPHALAIRGPPTVPWTWDAGWLYVGTTFYAQPDGFPRLEEATLGMSGGLSMAAEGGTLVVPQGNGSRTFRLGAHAESPASTRLPGVHSVGRMTFEGVLADASIPATAMWGIAAPTMSWTVDGEASWTNATGRVRAHGRETTFQDEPVRAEGAFRVVPEASRVVSALQPATYEGEGRFDALQVGARAPLAPPPTRMPNAAAGAAATLSLLAVLLALTETGRDLLVRLGAALYTRIVREDLLEHPLRRRLHEIVHAEPGLHLREAQRRLGTTWGPLAFHLRMLVQAGYLRQERRGGYTHVYPEGVGGEDAPVPHPLARRVHEALPEDGSPVPARRLRDQVGLSRQLLAYHLKALERRRLVTFVEAPEGERMVARVTPPAPRQG